MIKDHNDAVDWIITITFYYALHFVQAKLERDFNVDPYYHTNPDPQASRRDCVIKYLPGVMQLYNNLYNESMKARYVKHGVYRDYKTYAKIQSLISRAKIEFPKLLT